MLFLFFDHHKFSFSIIEITFIWDTFFNDIETLGFLSLPSNVETRHVHYTTSRDKELRKGEFTKS